MNISERIDAIEKASGISLRDDQRMIVVNSGYPLFQLMGMTRCWGKTTVAMFWTLTHDSGPIFVQDEQTAWGNMRDARLLKENMFLPQFPDPDILFHPIMIKESYMRLRDLSIRCSGKGIEVPTIVFPKICMYGDFLNKKFHI